MLKHLIVVRNYVRRYKSILPIIEPIIDAFTRFNNPADIAVIPIIISAALPKVTLSKEATVGP
jgi:hypothetical protein